MNRSQAVLLQRICLIVLFVGLSACSSMPTPPWKKPAQQSTDRKAPASKRAPIAKSTINFDGRCVQKDIDGFSENAAVNVKNNVVKSLSWEMRIGRKGTCRFNGKDFRQTRTTPNIELTASDGSGCRLLMWAEPRRITLAHQGCAKKCTPGAYGGAWPAMFDPQSGKCADLTK